MKKGWSIDQPYEISKIYTILRALCRGRAWKQRQTKISLNLRKRCNPNPRVKMKLQRKYSGWGSRLSCANSKTELGPWKSLGIVICFLTCNLYRVRSYRLLSIDMIFKMITHTVWWRTQWNVNQYTELLNIRKRFNWIRGHSGNFSKSSR